MLVTPVKVKHAQHTIWSICELHCTAVKLSSSRLHVTVYAVKRNNLNIETLHYLVTGRNLKFTYLLACHKISKTVRETHSCCLPSVNRIQT